ncbi:DUF2254 domain-containing protein [Jiella sp. M17.18]|uniref:DUF2254 domain-containing protein n=1 Tax=Jiella sp. M17.18 TaxID=3234247 RepID=UPI0034DDF322
MRALMLQTYERIIGSYWFIPSVMALLAGVLAFGLIEIDQYLPRDVFGTSPFLFSAQPDGARAVLGAIGGSMITVAGTVFSVTMATVVFASGTYGPRLLTNFMQDRGNQVTLGVFVATFIYTMLVLRSVRDGGPNSGYGPMFVPTVAIYGGLFLAIVSIGVLIYFIHHVPSNIHISNVISGIGESLLKRMDKEFAKRSEEEDEDEAQRLWNEVPACFRSDRGGERQGGGYAEIACDRTGYLQIVDRNSLISAACEHGLVVRMICRPGMFVHPGRVLFDAWPKDRVDDDTRDALLASIAAGSSRSPRQDINFLFDELVEIAGRALSPGVNDPYTAITCMDWLKAACCKLASMKMPSRLIGDEEGNLRLIAMRAGFAEFLEVAFGHIRQYAASDMIAGEHYLNCLAQIAPACRDDEQREAVRFQKTRFLGLARLALDGSALKTVEAAGKRVTDCLSDPTGREETLEVASPAG